MKRVIRRATDNDRKIYVDLAVKLSEFNRKMHDNISKYDDFNNVKKTIINKAKLTFDKMDENTLILIAELDDKAVGYALARIYKEDESSDNGTGYIGLFDEVYVLDEARGHGLGQTLLDEIINWIKSRGIKRVKLHAYSWNENAKSIYEKNGFSEYAVSYEKYL